MAVVMAFIGGSRLNEIMLADMLAKKIYVFSGICCREEPHNASNCFQTIMDNEFGKNLKNTMEKAEIIIAVDRKTEEMFKEIAPHLLIIHHRTLFGTSAEVLETFTKYSFISIVKESRTLPWKSSVLKHMINPARKFNLKSFEMILILLLISVRDAIENGKCKQVVLHYSPVSPADSGLGDESQKDSSNHDPMPSESQTLQPLQPIDFEESSNHDPMLPCTSEPQILQPLQAIDFDAWMRDFEAHLTPVDMEVPLTLLS